MATKKKAAPVTKPAPPLTRIEAREASKPKPTPAPAESDRDPA